MKAYFGLAALLGALTIASPAFAVDAQYDGYAQGQKPLASHAAIHKRIVDQAGTPAAVLLASPGAGSLGYTAAAMESGVAFAAAHRPAVNPTMTATELLSQPGAGASGYDFKRQPAVHAQAR